MRLAQREPNAMIDPSEVPLSGTQPVYRLGRDPGRFFCEPEERSEELIRRLIQQSSRVLIKKLAKNDRQWAIWDPAGEKWKSNQAGPYMPADARTSGFFPPLAPDPKLPHNRSCDVRVIWPTTGKIYESRFIWYSNKGPTEHHLTTNPRSEFAALAPASFLLIFRTSESEDLYWALTVDAENDDLCDYIREVFGIPVDAEFHFRIYEAASLDPTPRRTVLQSFIEEVIARLYAGPDEFAAYLKTLRRRSAAEISAAALRQWKVDTGNVDMNPYRLSNPGDVLLELTRKREFAIYKMDEAMTYGAEVVDAIAGNGKTPSVSSVVCACIERFDELYSIFLRASQARSSRVGGTFESHMATVLTDGRIPHQGQPVFGGSRPDFVLPNSSVYHDAARRPTLALVLALKTTLRERWRQVVSESAGCPVFLATLDEGVPAATLDKLAERGIVMVVPERFKTSEYSDYVGRADVMTFRTFFDRVSDQRREAWRGLGLDCF